MNGVSTPKILDNRHDQWFDQQRFVPFIYADITDHVKFASELEIEHGIRGPTENEISRGIRPYRLLSQ